MALLPRVLDDNQGPMTKPETSIAQASVKVVAPESEENSLALPGCFRLEAPRCGFEIHKLKGSMN